MQTIETMKRRIKTAQDLKGIVRTMKTLAAVNIRHYERAVEALGDYNRAVLMGLEILLRRGEPITSAEPAGERLCAVIFGSDQGMCGRLNEQIISHAIADIENRGHSPRDAMILAIGSRVALRLEDASHRTEAVFHLPSSIPAITNLVQDVMMKIDAARRERGIERIVLYYSELLSGATYKPATLQLLPIDRAWFEYLARRPWPTKMIPAFTMEPGALLSSLIRQYLFVSIYRAVAESLASENASRLAAMQAAEKNIDRRLHDFTFEFHRARQAAITEELFDIVSGYEAQTGAEG